MGSKRAVRYTSRTTLHLGACTPHHQIITQNPFEEGFGSTWTRMRATFPKFFGMHRTEEIPIYFHKL